MEFLYESPEIYDGRANDNIFTLNRFIDIFPENKKSFENCIKSFENKKTNKIFINDKENLVVKYYYKTAFKVKEDKIFYANFWQCRYLVFAKGKLYSISSKKIYRLNLEKNIDKINKILLMCFPVLRTVYNGLTPFNVEDKKTEIIALNRIKTYILKYWKIDFLQFNSKNMDLSNEKIMENRVFFHEKDMLGLTQKEFNFLINKFKKYSKSVKKYVIENNKITYLYALNYIGIKNPEVLLKFLKKTDENIFSNLIKMTKAYLKMLKEFYKGTNNNAELLLFKRIEKMYANEDELYESYLPYFDTMQMLRKHWKNIKKIGEDPFKDKKLAKMSLLELHDELAKIIRSEENLLHYAEYKYTESELKIDGYKIKNMTFHLPKNSIELNDLSEKMNNCVASYSNRIVNKNSLIIYAKRKNEYVACIEIVNNSVWQCYGKSNRHLEENEQKICDKFFKHFNFCIKTFSDELPF